MPILDLSDILNILVNMPAVAAPAPSFSLGLILSQNTVISTTDRVKTYGSVTEMITAGFESNGAEVNAATLYFGQSPAPSQIAVGVQGAGETPVQAITACRTANNLWYGFAALGAVDADIEALAAYAEATPNTVQFYTTSSAAVLAGTADNVALTLQAADYNRSLGIYSTMTANAAAAVMGYASGANTGAYNSFTLADKTLIGVTPEPITEGQLQILEAANINVYTTRLNRFTVFELGVMASGADFGDIVGIDILVKNIQTNVMQLRMNSAKIPLTDAGMAQYDTAITQALTAAFNAGFLAAGIWDGSTVGTLTNGTAMPNGYSIQAGSVANLSASDKSAGNAPAVYVCIYKAGNIRKFVLTVDVSQ
jgi:hypothetical protein